MEIINWSIAMGVIIVSALAFLFYAWLVLRKRKNFTAETNIDPKLLRKLKRQDFSIILFLLGFVFIAIMDLGYVLGNIWLFWPFLAFVVILAIAFYAVMRPLI